MLIFVKVLSMAAFAVVTLFFGGAIAKAEEDFDLFGVADKMDPILLSKASRDAIEKVQEAFYERGFHIIVDGDFGAETTKVISQWQAIMKRPVTGGLTLEQWEALLATKPPSNWGALAVATDGTYGEAHGKNTRALAERIALRRCQLYTKLDCIVRSEPDRSWIVAGWCKKGRVVTALIRAHPTEQAKAYKRADQALVLSGFDPYNGKDCFKAVAIHALYGDERTFTEREGFEVEHQADGLLVDVPK